jgi:hypothetical protein
MAASDPALMARISTLEAQVRELILRVAALEVVMKNSARTEHAQDRHTVGEKVAFDWQK